MADENETAEVAEEEKKKSGGISIIVMLIVAVACGAAGFAVPIFFPGLFVATDAAEEKEDAEPVATEPAFLSFDESVVNLNSDRFNRYLRLKIMLQIDKTNELEMTERLERHKAILKSWLLSYLSDQSMETIRGAAGQNRLRREILNEFNDVLCPDGFDLVEDVLFEDFNVQ